MKLKYLLASGLFLSTAFVACTNDDFAEISAPVANTEDAIALGEGFTIKVNKGGVDTRSAFNENLSPYWEEGDEIGAAWVHMVTGFNAETLLVNDPDGCGFIGKEYGGFYSNHPFTLSEGANTNNGTFTSPTNAFAGAYVLYYPFDPEVAMTGDEIPVGIKTYEADCENPQLNPSENMFSYGPAKFVPGGPRTGEFTLGQIPVLVELKFNPSSKLNHDLTGGIKINNIVIEAEANGEDVLVREGHIVTGVEPQAANYNGTNGADLSGIVKYVEKETCENLFITLKNNDADKFKLMVKDQPTEGSFVFSMLPLEEKATKVVIKVVTDRGVFSTTYDANDADASKKALAEQKLEAFNGTDTDKGAAYEGGQVRMEVVLDVSTEDDVIYTSEEFMERWAEACKTYADDSNQNQQTLEIGTDLTLTEPLVCSDENYRPNILVTGNYSLEVPSIEIGKSYGIKFQSVDLNVVGDVSSSGSSVFEASNLSARNIKIEGQGDVTVAEAEKLTVAASGIVEVKGLNAQSYIKSVVIEEGTTTQGVLTYNGSLAINSLQSDAKATLVLEADFTNMAGSELTIGALDLNGRKLTNAGVVNLNGVYTYSKDSEIINNGQLNVNHSIDNVKLTNSNSGAVNVKEGATLTARSTTYTIQNNGVIDVYGTLKEYVDGAMTSTGNVFARTETAKIQFPSTNTTKWAGYVFILNNNNVSNGDDERLSYQLNNAEDAPKVKENADDVTNVFVNADVTSEVLVNSKLNDKNLIFQKNLTLTGDMTANFDFQVMGNVTISGKGHSLTLAKGKTHEVWKGATLRVNNGVTLKGEGTNKNKSVLNVEGQIVNNGRIDANTLSVVQK